MNIIKITEDSAMGQSEIGGKGYNLQRLIKAGFDVPETFVITAGEVRKLSNTSSSDKPKLGIDIEEKTNKLFAVRSSGVGEDGNEHSFAGIFETYLNVRTSDLYKSVLGVYSSKNTAVTTMYNAAKNTHVSDMAVIIQQMIDADFAGVAFSVNPIELDPKVGLIEIIKGVGEDLVSGKRKPTSARINRITGMHRVMQSGADILSSVQVEDIVDRVSHLLWRVADMYGKPIDIEWAIKDGTVYLLQARPITNLGELK